MLLNLKRLSEKYQLQVREIGYVGANLGQEIPELNVLFNNPTIHLFEPQKNVFKKLKCNFNDLDNLVFYNFALGSKTTFEEININTNNSNQSSSILKPKKHNYYHPDILFEGKEKIKVQKFSDLNLNNINFLSIDVQGYELEVLKGCENKLSNIEYILCEVSRKELFENCALINDIDKYLKHFDFLRVKTVWWEKTIPWGDALYIKKNQLNFIQIISSNINLLIQRFRGYFFIISIPKKILNFLKRNINK